MSKWIFWIACFHVVIFSSCGSQDFSNLQGEEKEVVDRTHAFLSWYRDNYYKIVSLTDELVPYSADTILDNQYAVDFTNAESYVDFLDSSGFFSKGYVLDLYNYLQDCDRRMRLAKQSDGPPMGLEVDPILKTHEPQDIFERLETSNVKSVQVAQQKATVVLEFVGEKEFSLVKINDNWYLE